MAKSITAAPVPTAFDRGITRFTWLMIRFMAVMVPLVFVINGVTKHDWHEAFFFALAVAVGLTPEMLPMIVSVCLSKGAVAMARERVIVKRLDAIQNFGAMDVLCTDKTGTLTMDEVILEMHCDVTGVESRDVLLGGRRWSVTSRPDCKNVLDRAILTFVERDGNVSFEGYRKVDEVPFDFSRKLMSVVVARPDGGYRLIAKGAPEEIFRRCTHFSAGGDVFPVEAAFLADLPEEYDRLSADGFRVLAVAYRDLPPRAAYGKEDESDLTLAGYVAFLDPPKESARPALDALRQAGIAVKVLTGDNELVTRKICEHVGLAVDTVVLGRDLDGMTDAALADVADRSTVFARLSPAHKQRIIQALQARRHVVGFLGDGINDAAGLHAADVGVSVDTAVDVAKASADIILLEKSLLVLRGGRAAGSQGVLQHRQVRTHGRQLELRQHVQRAGRERGAAVRADGADSGADQQSAVRLLPGADSDRQRGCGAGRAAAPVGHGRDRAFHPLRRTHQLHLRLHDLRRHVFPVRRAHAGTRGALSDGLVRRVPDDADAHHPRHSHEPDPVPAESRQLATHRHDDGDHGHWPLPAGLSRGVRPGFRPAAARVLADPWRHTPGLRDPDSIRESVSPPPRVDLIDYSRSAWIVPALCRLPHDTRIKSRGRDCHDWRRQRPTPEVDAEPRGALASHDHERA